MIFGRSLAISSRKLKLVVSLNKPVYVEKGLLFGVECFDASGNRISHKNLNWSYSQKVDSSFQYINDTEGKACVEFKQIESRIPIARIAMSLHPWQLSDGSTEIKDILYTAVHPGNENSHESGIISANKGEVK